MSRVASAAPAAPERGEDPGTPVRVLVADPDALARRIVRDALDGAPGVVAVANAEDAREARELARFYRPDVVITEGHFPAGDGVELTRQLAEEVPETRVLLLCARDDGELPLRALRAGAAGYLTKDVDPGVLPRVVRKVAEGEVVVPRTIVKRLVESLREVPDTGWRPVRSRLTTREWEIVDLLRAGASTEAIADRLFLSPATVYSHVKSVLNKLGVHSRREAIHAAERLRREEAAPTLVL